MPFRRKPSSLPEMPPQDPDQGLDGPGPRLKDDELPERTNQSGTLEENDHTVCREGHSAPSDGNAIDRGENEQIGCSHEGVQEKGIHIPPSTIAAEPSVAESSDRTEATRKKSSLDGGRKAERSAVEAESCSSRNLFDDGSTHTQHVPQEAADGSPDRRSSGNSRREKLEGIPTSIGRKKDTEQNGENDSTSIEHMNCDQRRGSGGGKRYSESSDGRPGSENQQMAGKGHASFEDTAERLDLTPEDRQPQRRSRDGSVHAGDIHATLTQSLVGRDNLLDPDTNSNIKLGESYIL